MNGNLDGGRNNKMTRELDTRTIGDVVSFAEDLARGFRQNNEDTLDLIKRYKASNILIAESIDVNLPEEQARIFALAMVMIRDMYYKIHEQYLDNAYVVVGARYLLMPEREFQNKLNRYDYDLFKLKKEYPHVSYKMIAHHVCDIERCFVCMRKDGKYHGQFKHQKVTVNLDYRTADRIADKTLNAHDRTYTQVLSDAVTARGWQISDHEVVIIIFGDEI